MRSSTGDARCRFEGALEDVGFLLRLSLRVSSLRYASVGLASASVTSLLSRSYRISGIPRTQVLRLESCLSIVSCVWRYIAPVTGSKFA